MNLMMIMFIFNMLVACTPFFVFFLYLFGLIFNYSCNYTLFCLVSSYADIQFTNYKINHMPKILPRSNMIDIGQNGIYSNTNGVDDLVLFYIHLSGHSRITLHGGSTILRVVNVLQVHPFAPKYQQLIHIYVIVDMGKILVKCMPSNVNVMAWIL